MKAKGHTTIAPKRPPMGSCCPSEYVKKKKKTPLAITRGKRVRPQAELPGWVLEQTVTPKGKPIVLGLRGCL